MVRILWVGENHYQSLLPKYMNPELDLSQSRPLPPSRIRPKPIEPPQVPKQHTPKKTKKTAESSSFVLPETVASEETANVIRLTEILESAKALVSPDLQTELVDLMQQYAELWHRLQ